MAKAAKPKKETSMLGVNHLFNLSQNNGNRLLIAETTITQAIIATIILKESIITFRFFHLLVYLYKYIDYVSIRTSVKSLKYLLKSINS